MARDLAVQAQDNVVERLTDEFKGFHPPEDIISFLEGLDHDFDAESVCPYYTQQDEIINEYEATFGSDAEDICGTEEEYTASDWQKAKTAYAYAIAYCAYSQLFYETKNDLKTAIENFIADVELDLDNVPEDDLRIQVTISCPHGWAAHNRETEEGVLLWESGQLDGNNGAAVEAQGLWLSTCFAPKPTEEA